MTQLLDAPAPAQGNNGGTIARRQTVMGSLADRYQMDAGKLLETLKATCIKGNATNEQVQAFCIVANRYGLDPFLKEIHAFASQGGGIAPIVGVDGWAKIANSRDEFDGCDFKFDGEGNNLSCTCTVYVKGRAHPIPVTEYLSECKRNTPPWNTYPRRMLRHRAFMQAVRIAFGVGGIFDEDEAREIIHNEGGTPATQTRVDNLNQRLQVTSRPVSEGQTLEPTPEALAEAASNESLSRPGDETQGVADQGELATSSATTMPDEPPAPAHVTVAEPPEVVYAQWLEQCEAVAQESGVTPGELSKGIGGILAAKGLKDRPHELPDEVRARTLNDIRQRSGLFAVSKKRQ